MITKFCFPDPLKNFNQHMSLCGSFSCTMILCYCHAVSIIKPLKIALNHIKSIVFDAVAKVLFIVSRFSLLFETHFEALF